MVTGMTGREAMRYAVDSRRLTQQEIAEIAGYARQTNVAGILRSDNARVDNLVRILNACGYELVMIDRSRPDIHVTITATPTPALDESEMWGPAGRLKNSGKNKKGAKEAE